MENNNFYYLLAKQQFINADSKLRSEYLKLGNDLIMSMKVDKQFNSCPAIQNMKPMDLEDLEKKFGYFLLPES